MPGPNVLLNEVVTVGDFARLYGLKIARVGNWAMRHNDFPAPVRTFGMSKVYVLWQIEAWVREQYPNLHLTLDKA